MGQSPNCLNTASMRLFAVVCSLLVCASAQSSSTEKVWAVVAFINSGERTPIGGDSVRGDVLTPEGAQQMLRQGTAFRARYIRNGVNITHEDIETAYIQNINKDVLDNSEIDSFALDSRGASTSSLAFFQGLYPPITGVWDSDTGGSDLGANLPAQEGTESNRTQYPLGGYQYPWVSTFGFNDEASVFLDGTSRCSAWETEVRNMSNQAFFRDAHEQTKDWYRQLFSTAPLVGTFDLSQANVYNAYGIYEYVDYMYRHNESVYKNLKDPNETLSTLAHNAFTMEYKKNSFPNRNGVEDPANVLYTISGRTLASYIAGHLQGYLDWGYGEMTLIFGEYSPILSFVSVSLLGTKQRLTEGPFNEIPRPGAAVVFELFGTDPEVPSRLPEPKDLKVRFYYKASSDLNEPFQLLPLFGLNSTSISYETFSAWMSYIGRDQYQWCDICGPTPAPWCTSISKNNKESESKKKALAPALGGLIGAVVTLVVVGIIGLGLFFLGGFRLRREKKAKSEDAAGGFKGIEKKDGDKDVVVARNGVHHERVGSWELRDGKPLGGSAGTGGGIVKVMQEGKSTLSPCDDDNDDDKISILGATPVKAHESV